MSGSSDFASARPKSTPDSVLDEVLSERLRQINRHGFTAERDDAYSPGVLSDAAACYAMRATRPDPYNLDCPALWPWPARWWKPGTMRRSLIKAMALCCAEVERIDRAEARRG